MNLVQIIQSNPAILKIVAETLRANPDLSMMLFKEVSPEIFRDLDSLRASIQGQTTTEQQIFISSNRATLIPFLNSDSGKECLQVFLDGWESHVKSSK